jgi:hypothetical protein
VSKHTPTTADNLEDRQAEIDDIKKLAQALLDSLDCAEGCETPTDFDANIEAVFENMKEITAALKELRE